MRRIEWIVETVSDRGFTYRNSEASRNERPSSFSMWKTLFHSVLTKCYNYCKIERVIIVCSYDVSSKSIEQIYNSLITVTLLSKHTTKLR
jgi:hypothetical protein